MKLGGKTELTNKGRIIALVPVFFLALGFLMQNPYNVLIGMGIISMIFYSKYIIERNIDLDFECEVTEKAKTVDESFPLIQKIFTRNPVWLEFNFDKNKGFSFHDASYEGLIKSEKRHRFDVTPLRRGYHKIGHLSGWIYEPLKIFRKSFEYDPNLEVVVHSSREAIKKAHQYSRRSHHEFLTNKVQRYVTDRGEMESVRDYVPGDRFRDIHWKSVSKLQQLMTKVYENESLSQCHVLLDSGPSMRKKAGNRNTKLDHSIYIALELLKNFELSGHDIGLTVFNHKKTIFHHSPDHKRETFKRLYNEMTNLPESIPNKGYKKKRYGRKEDDKRTNNRFTKKVSQFVSRSNSSRLSGILSAVKKIRAKREHSLIVIISDLENSTNNISRGIKRLKELDNEVWIIVPFSPWYESEDSDEETLEAMYQDYEKLEDTLERFIRLGSTVFELHPTEEGFNILERGGKRNV